MMRALTRAEAKRRPFTTSADLSDTVLRLWREAGYREERYAAIALLDTPAARRLREPAALATLRELIVTGAWWDYVDELAHRVGDLLLSWPAEVRPAVRPAAATGPVSHRRQRLLPAQSNRMGAAGLRPDRPGMGSILCRNPRAQPAVTTRGAETLVMSFVCISLLFRYCSMS